MPSPELETARLRLRRFTPADLEEFAALYSDPEVMKFLGDGVTISKEEALHHLNNLKDNYWERHHFGRWALIHKEDGRLAGYCGLRLLDDTPELVYVLARKYWGRGLATEAARACLSYAFGRLGLRRVVAITRPPNLASRRVLDRLGMKFEKEETFYGYDCVLYSITREEYAIVEAENLPL